VFLSEWMTRPEWEAPGQQSRCSAVWYMTAGCFCAGSSMSICVLILIYTPTLLSPEHASRRLCSREGGAWMEVALKTYYLDAADPTATAVHLLVDTRIAQSVLPSI
jgi:hypothetical protein